MQRDILEELHKGVITAADVYSLADETDPSAISSHWGLSRSEWTAYCHGADWTDLVEWRYYGWPSQCAVCGERLPDEKEFGWFVLELANGSAGLRHIGCKPAK